MRTSLRKTEDSIPSLTDESVSVSLCKVETVTLVKVIIF